MANPYKNKVQVVRNGATETLIDLTSDTVTPASLAQGYTAHDASGAPIVGTASGGGTEAGTVYQDGEGFIVLDDDAPSGRITVEPLSITTNGTYTAPTGKAYTPVTVNVSGGGGDEPTPWVRPSDWPDLSKMDVSGGDILYMTSYADEARGFCRFRVYCTGNYTVEVGSISGSTFTADSSQDYASGNWCELYYGATNGTYKVLRVTGTAITQLDMSGTNAVTIGTFNGYHPNQGIVDVVGKLPSGTMLKCDSKYNLVNMEIDGLNLTGSCSSMFSSCYSLTNLDVSGWSTGSVTSMSSMFNGCTSLTSLDVSGWNLAGMTTASSAASIFRFCRGLYGSLTLPASMAQIGTYCFTETRSLTEYHFLATTPPTLANTNAFSNMTDFGGKKIYVPAASLSDYQAATNWSTYATYMVGE